MNPTPAPNFHNTNSLKSLFLTSGLFFAFMSSVFSQNYSAKIGDTLVIKNPTPLIVNGSSIGKVFFLDEYLQVDAVGRVLSGKWLVKVKESAIDSTNGNLVYGIESIFPFIENGGDSFFLYASDCEPYVYNQMVKQHFRSDIELKQRMLSHLGKPYTWGGIGDSWVQGDTANLFNRLPKLRYSDSITIDRSLLRGVDCSGLPLGACDGFLPTNTSTWIAINKRDSSMNYTFDAEGLYDADNVTGSVSGIFDKLDSLGGIWTIVRGGHMMIYLGNNQIIESRHDFDQKTFEPDVGGVRILQAKERMISKINGEPVQRIKNGPITIDSKIPVNKYKKGGFVIMNLSQIYKDIYYGHLNLSDYFPK